jgi:uncharacterized membrane protein YdbT with pleckstrin-like domain
MRTKLKQNEKIILTTKLHWYPSLFYPILFSSLCFIIGIIVGSASGFFYVIALAAVGFAVYKILERQCNIWVVTNLRVIDEGGLLTHYAIESPLDKINNVSYSQSIGGRQLGYGNVVIQTAAGYGVTPLYGAENPQRLKDTITSMQEEYKKTANKEQAKAFAGAFSNGQQNYINTSIANELEKIFDLKQKGVLTEEEYKNLKAKILNS